MESAKNISRPLKLLIDDDYVTTTSFDETYDKSRIIYADEIPVEEEDFEIQDSPEICIKTESIDGLISPIPSYYDEHLKSPMNTISDYGYESHGSPLSIQEFSPKEYQDDISYLLNDLFPALA